MTTDETPTLRITPDILAAAHAQAAAFDDTATTQPGDPSALLVEPSATPAPTDDDDTLKSPAVHAADATTEAPISEAAVAAPEATAEATDSETTLLEAPTEEAAALPQPEDVASGAVGATLPQADDTAPGAAEAQGAEPQERATPEPPPLAADESAEAPVAALANVVPDDASPTALDAVDLTTDAASRTSDDLPEPATDAATDAATDSAIGAGVDSAPSSDTLPAEDAAADARTAATATDEAPSSEFTEATAALLVDAQATDLPAQAIARPAEDTPTTSTVGHAQQPWALPTANDHSGASEPAPLATDATVAAAPDGTPLAEPADTTEASDEARIDVAANNSVDDLPIAAAAAADAPVTESPVESVAATTVSTADGAPATEPRDPEFERYYAVRNHFGNLAFSPDSSQLAMIVNTSGQFNIWRQSVTGGWATQITTFEDESARAVVWAPSGELYGAADRAGSEQYDIFTIPATGGVTTYLTDRPDVQYVLSEDSLSPDGRLLAYAGNDRQPTDGDVLVRDLRTGEVHRLLANGRYNLVGNWSPDGRYLTAVDLRSNTDLHVWLIEVATGEAREILAHDDQFFIVPGPWLPDSSGFYVITDRGREFKGIARYRLEPDEMEWLVAPEWDVEQVALSADGRRLIWALNESGRSQLYLRDDDQAPLRVVGLPVGVFETLTLSPDGQTLALRINAATAPAEVYIVTLGLIGALTTPHLRRLTFGMLGGLDGAALVEPELVMYPTFDGRQIPAWLYRPRDLAPGQQTPLVVSIHGGPEAQERVEYKALYQYLLAKGIGVLAPNIRGSTGYGLAYQKLIHRDWGGAELRDIQAAAEYAQTLPWVNPARLGVYGGSFGGFATLSAATRLPDYWAAAVDIVGPSNLLTFVRSVPPTWRRMMTAWVGDPDVEADAEMMRERSPITYVENLRAPLLVLQGANDPRVAQAESDQMVERLRGMGREVAYVVFADEGHGFTKRANTLRAYRLAADFFLRWLRA